MASSALVLDEQADVAPVQALHFAHVRIVRLRISSMRGLPVQQRSVRAMPRPPKPSCTFSHSGISQAQPPAFHQHSANQACSVSASRSTPPKPSAKLRRNPGHVPGRAPGQRLAGKQARVAGVHPVAGAIQVQPRFRCVASVLAEEQVGSRRRAVLPQGLPEQLAQAWITPGAAPLRSRGGSARGVFGS